MASIGAKLIWQVVDRRNFEKPFLLVRYFLIDTCIISNKQVAKMAASIPIRLYMVWPLYLYMIDYLHSNWSFLQYSFWAYQTTITTLVIHSNHNGMYLLLELCYIPSMEKLYLQGKERFAKIAFHTMLCLGNNY